MGLKVSSRLGAASNTVAALGLNPELYNLASDETIAALIRRVASFLTPCKPGAIVAATSEPLKGLVDDPDLCKSAIEDILDSLIAHGDLMETDYDAHDLRGHRGSAIYASPPCFIRRQSGVLILIGIPPDNTSLLSEEQLGRIIYKKHIRLLPPNPLFQDAEVLLDLGYVELQFDIWSKLPRKETAADYLKRADQKLTLAPPAGSLGEVEIIGPWTQDFFYKRRWVTPTKENGRYVGRRKHIHRGDIWGYFEFQEGEPVKFIDLPFDKQLYRGCDDAWRLQAALDYNAGIPQVFGLRAGTANDLIFDFFSPVPMWASRRWDAIGNPAQKEHCVFSYVFSSKEAEEEMRFIDAYLWIKKR
jgi:hypothetical protein